MSQIEFEKLPKLPLEEVKVIEKVRHNADLYLEAYMGNMLYPATPLKVIISNEEMFKVPIKSHFDKGLHTLGYLYLDAKNLEINKGLSSSRDDIDKVIEEISSNESTLL